jgi:hypothetical protein
MKRHFTSNILISATLFLFVASPVFAATAVFQAANPEIQTGNAFEAKFLLNTENEDINAVEGRIVYPVNLFTVKEIRDADSFINLWIERPKANNGEIVFSGITPGGYIGDKSLIFSVIFQSTQEGTGTIQVKDLRVLLNDGNGTETTTTSVDLPLTVSSQASGTQPVVPVIKDTEPPEVFEPVISSNPAIFDGQYFLVFATQDKGSGMDHYEVREGRGPFVTAESPHLLQDQNLNNEISVKAVDRSGNERIAVIPAQHPLPWYWNMQILAILVATGLVLFIVLFKLFGRKRGK